MQNSVFPVYAGSLPHDGDSGIKRAPRKAYAPAVSDRTWPEQTKSLSLPPSGPSAAPAPINRHRIHLCRAVAMFDSGPSRRRPQTSLIALSRRLAKGVTESLSAALFRARNSGAILARTSK
jgi:hypothetical protein